jgi:glutamate/tyrosine decarboxylase-like PLP-dependent enzyme
MSVRSTVQLLFEHVAVEQERKLAALTDDVRLIDCGLDSLSFAIIVARLEDTLGFDLNSLQWSRRFMGLRLFLSLAAAGWEGCAAHVERAVTVIERARERLEERGWSAVNDSQLAVLCLLSPPGYPPVREIVRRLLESARAWAAVASHEGQDVVRICATHGETAERDVDELVGALEATAALSRPACEAAPRRMRSSGSYRE